MFQKAELERLQQQKELLLLQSDVHRLLLATDWQRLRSPANWLNEAGNVARRHPVWTAARRLAIRQYRGRFQVQNELDAGGDGAGTVGTARRTRCPEAANL